jgi:mRNA-degrading endonuclease RelE of RelBE toxin-antitoxin system
MKKQEKTSKNTSTQPTKIEQNLNINITPHVFETLAKLEKVNPELAKKAFELLEYDIKNSHEEKKTILKLEIEEQKIRKEEMPHIRKLAFRGQLFAFITGLAGLGASIYFGSIGMEKAAYVSIAIPLGVLAVNFIGKKKNG